MNADTFSIKFCQVYVYSESGDLLGKRVHFEVDNQYCPLPRGRLCPMAEKLLEKK